MFIAAVVSAVCVFAILALELRGFRTLEIGIMIFVLVIGLCYLVEIFLVHPTGGRSPTTRRAVAGSAKHLCCGKHAGATVMPHVVYLHSGLVQPRLAAERGTTPRKRGISHGCATFAWKRWMCLLP